MKIGDKPVDKRVEREQCVNTLATTHTTHQVAISSPANNRRVHRGMNACYLVQLVVLSLRYEFDTASLFGSKCYSLPATRNHSQSILSDLVRQPAHPNFYKMGENALKGVTHVRWQELRNPGENRPEPLP